MANSRHAAVIDKGTAFLTTLNDALLSAHNAGSLAVTGEDRVLLAWQEVQALMRSFSLSDGPMSGAEVAVLDELKALVRGLGQSVAFRESLYSMSWNPQPDWRDEPSALFITLLSMGRGPGSHAEKYVNAAIELGDAIHLVDGDAGRDEIRVLAQFEKRMRSHLHGAPAPPGSEPGATVEDAPPSDGPTEPPEPVETVLAELNELIGLDDVKTDVFEIVNLLRIQKMRETHGMPVPDITQHLVFVGNPGTGKTTIARLLARIYRSIGWVETGQLVEVGRADLVAEFVGQTAPKVTKVFQRAIGGVLFIDEAYSLARGAGSNDFGAEAIDTLVKLMEDHRDELVVILAGYPDEMGILVNANPGLESRFKRTLFFHDYGGDELLAILELFCRRNGIEMDSDAARTATERIASFERGHGFGNAREVRRLFERALINQATRLADDPDISAEEIATFHASDFADPDRPDRDLPA